MKKELDIEPPILILLNTLLFKRMLSFLRLILLFWRHRNLLPLIKLYKRMSKILKHSKAILAVVASLPLISAIIKFILSPTFNQIKKVMVYLSIILTLITIFTDVAPATSLSNFILAYMAVLQYVGSSIFDKLYLSLIGFLARRVDNPEGLIRLLDDNLIERRVVFKDTE